MGRKGPKQTEFSVLYNITINPIQLYEFVLIIVIKYYVKYILSDRWNRALPFI